MNKGMIKRLVTGAGALLLTVAFLLIPLFPAEASGTRIAAGGLHTVGLQPNGTVVAVGDNSYGQIEVGSWTDIIAVAAGYYHTVGLKSDGTVVAVGSNAEGQTNVGGWTDIVAVATGESHTIGLKSNGTVVAVGLNANNQTDVGSMSGIIAIAGGGYHTIGLKPNGTVVAVGNNSFGQTVFDDGRWTGIVAITGGLYTTVGLKSNGTVVAVGNNTHGQRDVDSWTDIVAVGSSYIHTVGLKSDGTVVAVGNNTYGQTNVGSMTDIIALAGGRYHNVGLKSDGTVTAAGALAPYDSGQTAVGSFFLEADDNFRGAKGTVLTLKGSGFGSKKGSVNVGGIPSRVITWFDSTIILQVKNALFPDSTLYPIEVIPGTKGAAPIVYGKAFIMKPPELHTIQASQGSAGSVVVLSGRYFGSKKGTVQVGSIFCPVKYWYMDTTNGSSMAVFTIPKTLAPEHYNVTLFGEAGSATFPSAAFTVKAAGSGNAHADHGSESYDPPDDMD